MYDVLWNITLFPADTPHRQNRTRRAKNALPCAVKFFQLERKTGIRTIQGASSSCLANREQTQKRTRSKQTRPCRSSPFCKHTHTHMYMCMRGCIWAWCNVFFFVVHAGLTLEWRQVTTIDRHTPNYHEEKQRKDDWWRILVCKKPVLRDSRQATDSAGAKEAAKKTHTHTAHRVLLPGLAACTLKQAEHLPFGVACHLHRSREGKGSACPNPCEAIQTRPLSRSHSTCKQLWVRCWNGFAEKKQYQKNWWKNRIKKTE